MKKVLFVLGIFALIGFSGCGNSNSTPTPTPTPTPISNGSMSAKIDGVQWNSTTVSGTLLKDQSFNAKRLDLNGSGGDKKIYLALEDDISGDCVNTGTYVYDGVVDNALFLLYITNSNGVNVGQGFPIDGTLNITSCDLTNKKVSGTFSFRLEKPDNQGGYDTLNITDGVFTDFKYTVLN